MSHTRVTTPAGFLNVDDGGTGGVPVVFLHSFAGTTEHWTKQLEHLRQRRRAVAFDLRGHGHSPQPPKNDYSIDSLTSDVAAVVDALGLDRFVLVGHSMGGSAAAAYAGAHPDRVAGLVLAETPGRSSKEQAQQVLGALEKDFDKTMEMYWTKLLTGAGPDVAARIQRERRSLSRDASMSMLRTIFAFDPIAPIGKFSGRKLAITTSATEKPEALHVQAPGFQHEAITGVSHWMQMDKPDEFNRILDGFFERVDAEERRRQQDRSMAATGR